MLKKNDFYQVNILRTGMDGEGIAEIDGMVVFVPGALVGECVRIKVLSVKKTYAYAMVDAIIEASPHRRQPVCPVYKRCGGCDLSHADYGAQLQIKREKIASALRKVDGVADLEIGMVGSDAEYGYRNKISLPVREVEGRLALGFFAARSHRFVAHNGCPLHSDALNGLADKILGIMNELGLKAYDEGTAKGFVRHLAIRELSHSFSVTVVINSKATGKVKEIASRLTEWDGRPVSVYANVNTRDTNVIFGQEFVRISGEEPCGEMCGVKFHLHPGSFLQVNTALAQKIFEHVKAELSGTDFLVDAYSGIGITSNVLAGKVGKVYSVEIVPEAVQDAKALAIACGNQDKIECILGDCKVEIPAVINRIKGKGTTSVFLDPPRKGCDESTLCAVLEAMPDKIIYLSCNPATLARDLDVLTKGGYVLTSITGYDMFAQTKHVETLAVLCNKNKK